MIWIIIAFWAGVGAHAAFVYLTTHPEQRAALYSRIRAAFHK
jgi:hypothetical protein